MNNTPHLDFITAFGQEFCAAHTSHEDLITPQDAYEVWKRAFNSEPTPTLLAAITEAQLKLLHTVCVSYFECNVVSLNTIRTAISQTLKRWPT